MYEIFKVAPGFTVSVNKTLDSRPIADIGRGLQGAVAGVNITIPTGEVGSDQYQR